MNIISTGIVPPRSMDEVNKQVLFNCYVEVHRGIERNTDGRIKDVWYEIRDAIWNSQEGYDQWRL